MGNLMEERVDLLLSPTTASQYIKYKNGLKLLNIDFRQTKSIGFFEIASILSKTSPGSQQVFKFFKCFTFNVWISIFLSIVISSLISSLNSFPVLFYKNLWNYVLLLYSKSSQKFLFNFKNKLILSFWLLSALILSIQFTAYLLDYMVIAIPVNKIDNLEQLVKSNKRIIARDDSALLVYAEKVETQLAKDIRPLIDPYTDFSAIKQNYIKQMKSGSHVYINQRLVLLFDAINCLENEFIDRNGQKLLDLLHISEDSGGLEPYFMHLYNIDEWIIKLFDKM